MCVGRLAGSVLPPPALTPGSYAREYPTVKDIKSSSKYVKVKSTKVETQQKEDPFDAEFDSFIRSIEDDIIELEEKYKKQ